MSNTFNMPPVEPMKVHIDSVIRLDQITNEDSFIDAIDAIIRKADGIPAIRTMTEARKSRLKDTLNRLRDTISYFQYSLREERTLLLAIYSSRCAAIQDGLLGDPITYIHGTFEARGLRCGWSQEQVERLSRLEMTPEEEAIGKALLEEDMREASRRWPAPTMPGQKSAFQMAQEAKPNG